MKEKHFQLLILSAAEPQMGIKMKLTAKLAFSQIKINRSRSRWTLLGIVLSTALLTALCSFTASGRFMAETILGEAIGGEYREVFISIVLPAVILCMIIITMSVIVISNAFRVSASERTAQFGILKSIGATKQQITATVMYESILLSAAGIPAGMIIGLFLTFGGIQTANHYLEEINRLSQVMIQEISFNLTFIISWQALTAALLVSFLTILLSAWLPARKAARITAIDSIRGAGEIKIKAKAKPKAKPTRINPFISKFFGFEGTLAAKNMKRNKRNFRASVIALTISIVFFITLFTLGEQAGAAGALLERMPGTVTVDYMSVMEFVSKNKLSGTEQNRTVMPISSEQANEITQILSEYENTPLYGIGSDLSTYVTTITSEALTPQMLEAIREQQYPPDRSQYTFPVELLTVDPLHYAELCKQAGVSPGANILINHNNYNNNGYETTISPFMPKITELELTAGNGEAIKIPIHGTLAMDQIPAELIYPNSRLGMVRLILPAGEMRGYTWLADPADIAGFIEYANQTMNKIFPRDQELSYMGLGFTTRAFETHDFMKVMNISIVVAEVLIWSFVSILMLIGLTSVISTISMNVRKRSREFAVLQSVGMTGEGIERMLNLESLLCALKSLLLGIPIAILLTYYISSFVRAMLPIPYRIPWQALIYCILGVFALTWFIFRHAAARLRTGNLMDTIRTESEL